MITWRRFLLDTCVLGALAMVLVVVGYVAAPPLAIALGTRALPAGAQIVFRSPSELHFWGFVAAFALPPIAAWFVDLIDHLRGRDAPSVRRLAAVALAVVGASAIFLAISRPPFGAFGGAPPMVSADELVQPSIVVIVAIAVVPIAAFLTTSRRPSAAPARDSAGSAAADSPASRD